MVLFQEKKKKTWGPFGICQLNRKANLAHFHQNWAELALLYSTLQAGIEFKKNLRVRFGNYGGLKLEYFWVVKSKKAKSFIRG